MYDETRLVQWYEEAALAAGLVLLGYPHFAGWYLVAIGFRSPIAAAIVWAWERVDRFRGRRAA